ncbi:helix-turn-helix domain-containing protein [Sphingobium yanoikuyae]|uniref:helix-turn-helix domain-containing protein n=1 Tax=Sphingobium yanoikuyae TaxID=13690 RepID=UPI000262B8FE|nr:helix-turn-helix transcriptional regulator [Sphingobium yanoikuyae]
MARIAGHHDTEGQLAQLGVAIRSKRKLAGLSQEALADAAGIDRSHMGKIERGERNVTFLNLSRIAAAVQLRLSELLTEAGL